MYQSKYEFITQGLNGSITTNVNLFHFNKEFSKIIDGDYITFAYQPIVSAKNGEIIGYEMLMRIFSDILNNPKKLIDIARENEKLDIVEELTFKKGFENYNQNIDCINGKKIFINSISNVKLADKVVKEILDLTNNNLDMLVVELTGLLKADKDVVLSKIKLFKSHNAKVAIDNFKPEFFDKVKASIKADYIKVDISIINNIETSFEQQNKLQRIVNYAKANNLKVVAVGIKNYEELAIVIKSGVDYLQGFYIGEPTVKPIKLKNGIALEIKSLQNK